MDRVTVVTNTAAGVSEPPPTCSSPSVSARSHSGSRSGSMRRCLVVFALAAAAPPWVIDLDEAQQAAVEQAEKDAMRPYLDDLMHKHKLHPGMIGDPKLAWLVKKAMGGEAYNKLFDYDAWRSELHAKKTAGRRKAGGREVDHSLRCEEPFEPGEEPPEHGWAFWYPETVPSEKKRAELVARRREVMRAAREAGTPLQPPAGYVYPPEEGADRGEL